MEPPSGPPAPISTRLANKQNFFAILLCKIPDGPPTSETNPGRATLKIARNTEGTGPLPPALPTTVKRGHSEQAFLENNGGGTVRRAGRLEERATSARLPAPIAAPTVEGWRSDRSGKTKAGLEDESGRRVGGREVTVLSSSGMTGGVARQSPGLRKKGISEDRGTAEKVISSIEKTSSSTGEEKMRTVDGAVLLPLLDVDAGAPPPSGTEKAFLEE